MANMVEFKRRESSGIFEKHREKIGGEKMVTQKNNFFQNFKFF